MFGLKPFAAQSTLRMAEISASRGGSRSFVGSGLIAGTKVASSLGWRAVECLAPGDKVLTFDHGMQAIKDISRATLRISSGHAHKALMPVVVPSGALGNRDRLTLLPEQGVMIESDTAHDPNGDPFAIIAASDLVGYRGIDRQARIGAIEIFVLSFEDPQVIYVEGGALVYCPEAFTTLGKMVAPARAVGNLSSTRDCDVAHAQTRSKIHSGTFERPAEAGLFFAA